MLLFNSHLIKRCSEHASSKFTAFIASETILIYKKFNRDLELLTVDAEKEFDTVNHDIMLNKLYHDGITGDMWLLLRNIYDGLILKVKWGDQTTESIDIKQGIRQGANCQPYSTRGIITQFWIVLQKAR